MLFSKHIYTFLVLLAACSLLYASCISVRQVLPLHPLLREVKEKTLIPEGIAIHPTTGRVNLSSLHQNKIISIDDAGAVSDVISNGQEGFMWGLGMQFSKDGDVLWACSADGKGNTSLFSIDHRSRRVIKRYTHDSARFFNDLVVMNDGRIFLTDTESGAVFLWQQDKIEFFAKDEKLKWANGITTTPAGDVLFVASGRYGIQKIDLSTHSITSATQDQRIDYAIDGMAWHQNTLYAAIGWPQDSIRQHRILRYHFDAAIRYLRTDTLSINRDWLQCPTTLAIHNNQLFALSLTNLGIYNRHQQRTINIMDSLRLPIVAVFQLPRK